MNWSAAQLAHRFPQKSRVSYSPNGTWPSDREEFGTVEGFSVSGQGVFVQFDGPDGALGTKYVSPDQLVPLVPVDEVPQPTPQHARAQLQPPTGETVARTRKPARLGEVNSDLWVWEPRIRLWLQAGELDAKTHDGFVAAFPDAEYVAVVPTDPAALSEPYRRTVQSPTPTPKES